MKCARLILGEAVVAGVMQAVEGAMISVATTAALAVIVIVLETETLANTAAAAVAEEVLVVVAAAVGATETGMTRGIETGVAAETAEAGAGTGRDRGIGVADVAEQTAAAAALREETASVSVTATAARTGEGIGGTGPEIGTEGACSAHSGITFVLSTAFDVYFISHVDEGCSPYCSDLVWCWRDDGFQPAGHFLHDARETRHACAATAE